MSIDVSIVVPVYNTEKFLPHCLDSILSQTLSNIEILAVDDGSTDNSLQIAENYARKDRRIKIISLSKNTNGGAGIPSNVGIDAAKGEYVGFVDSDDWIEPTMYENLCSVVSATGCEIALCNFQIFNNQRQVFQEANDTCYWKEAVKNHFIPGAFDQRSLLRLSPVPWRKLYRRAFLKRHQLKFPDCDYFFEDTPFHFFTILSAQSAALVDRVLYTHRVSRPNQTMSGSGPKFFAFIEHYRRILDFLFMRELFDKFKDEYISLILDNYFWVWDKLNPQLRRLFFSDLRVTLDRIPNRNVQHFISTQSFFNSLRLQFIVSGDFYKYERLTTGYKKNHTYLSRACFLLREYGVLVFAKIIWGFLKRSLGMKHGI
jgi:glycosyltransferase involved in cell wall biosynthesis